MMLLAGELCLFITVLWVGKFVSLSHGAMSWSVCVSPWRCCVLVSLHFSSQCCEFINLPLFLTILWVGQFVSVSHGAVGLSIYVGFSRCYGLVSLCWFLTVLWVGKFMFVPLGAVGLSVCVSRLVLWVGQFMFVLAVLWVDQLSLCVALSGHNYFLIVSIRLYAEHQITNSKYQSLQFLCFNNNKI